jgi:hypothetical protein
MNDISIWWFNDKPTIASFDFCINFNYITGSFNKEHILK